MSKLIIEIYNIRINRKPPVCFCFFLRHVGNKNTPCFDRGYLFCFEKILKIVFPFFFYDVGSIYI